MIKWGRSLFIAAVLIEMAALYIFLIEKGSMRSFLLITSSMICLQVLLLWESNFRLWRKGSDTEK